MMVLGVLVAFTGLVWIGQGLNLPLAPGSFMTGDRAWVLIGATAVVAGVALVARGRARS